MRKALLFFTMLLLAGSLWAADPTVGTWKQNLEKSMLPADDAANVKEAIVVFKELDANTMEGTSTETRKDGTKEVVKWTVPKSGGFQVYQQGGPEGDVRILSVVLDANTMYNVYVQDGKQVFLMPVSFSKDFRTFTISGKGMDAEGKPYEFRALYEKQ